MKVWITKYALTLGILEKTGSIVDSSIYGPSYIFRDDEDQWAGLYFGEDWHCTRESAIARANEMRLNKIASIRKSIAKLEALSFT